VQTGQHPRKTTEDNIANMRRQLRRIGPGPRRPRRASTTDPDYYRWTQWIFSQIFNAWYDADADGGRKPARPIASWSQEFAAGTAPRARRCAPGPS
jgi:leucyl-tRNA synthetase